MKYQTIQRNVIIQWKQQHTIVYKQRCTTNENKVLVVWQSWHECGLFIVEPQPAAQNVGHMLYKFIHVQNAGTCLPRQSWLSVTWLKATARRASLPVKSSWGLGSISRNSAQILVCFIAYIFQCSIPLWVGLAAFISTILHSAIHCPLSWEWSRHIGHSNLLESLVWTEVLQDEKLWHLCHIRWQIKWWNLQING